MPKPFTHWRSIFLRYAQTIHKAQLQIGLKRYYLNASKLGDQNNVYVEARISSLFINYFLKWGF